MEITPVGFLTLVAAAFIMARPTRAGLLIFAAFLPLPTAAAFNIWSAGGLSIIAANLLTVALVAGVAARPRMLKAVIRESLSTPAVVFFGLFLLYAVASAFFMPRLFEGSVNVYTLERPPPGSYGVPLTPLHPTTGNITQPMYMTMNFLLFAVMFFLLRQARSILYAAIIMNVLTGVHLVFAVMSAFPEIPPFAAALEFVRTANYSILTHHTMAGMRRLIGSYAEASSFGSISLSLFVWNFLRFMQTRGLWYLTASAALFTFVVLSFSTTAYAVFALLVAVWSAHTFYKLIMAGLSKDHLTALFASAIVAIVFTVFLFYPPARDLVMLLFERLFGAKLQSASGVERMAWNMQGLQNFIDTNGFGVGLGSARTSSLATVLLSNTGFIGAILFVGFMLTSFLRPWPKLIGAADDRQVILSRRIFVAARGATLALLFAHLLAGGNVDPGIIFVVYAAIAAAAYIPATRRRGQFNIAPIGGVEASFHAPRKRPFETAPALRTAAGASGGEGS